MPGRTAPVYIDLTVVSALAVEPLARGSGVRAGVAAELAERDKERAYPLIPVLPVAIEDHGRLGEKALAFVRQVAPCARHDRAIALPSLYQALGATLQRTAADAVLAAVRQP